MEEIIKNLICLINNSETKKMDKFSFGFFFKYEIENGKNILFIGIKEKFEKGDFKRFLQNESFCSENFIHKIIFKEKWELLKYILWGKFEIELFEILKLEKTEVENLNFYENKYFNDIFQKLILRIIENFENKNLKIEKIEDKINKIFEEMNFKETFEINFDDFLYQENEMTQNCEFIWENITNFKILDFKLEFEENICFLCVKFQIESFYEQKNILNYFDIEIPKFLSFSYKSNDEKILKNNLLLMFYLENDILYKMILDKLFEKQNIVSKSNIQSGIQICDLKKEFFSKIIRNENFFGKFFIGNEDIFIKNDVEKLFFEFLKRNNFKFEKKLFIKFLISCTGIEIEDFENINSFFEILNKIFLKYYDRGGEN